MKKPRYRLTVFPGMPKDGLIFWMCWKVMDHGIEWTGNTELQKTK